jgi:hypothetical protein
MFQTEIVEKIKTNILCPIIFYGCPFHMSMWKSIVEPDRPQMTIWFMALHDE